MCFKPAHFAGVITFPLPSLDIAKEADSGNHAVCEQGLCAHKGLGATSHTRIVPPKALCCVCRQKGAAEDGCAAGIVTH